MKRRCLITGEAGFIGSNLADYLIKLNHKVKILELKNNK
tara:strand:+ start:304 stop:420 length:117 start_codon:yes stop_codon:yes gene_type:complete